MKRRIGFLIFSCFSLALFAEGPPKNLHRCCPDCDQPIVKDYEGYIDVSYTYWAAREVGLDAFQTTLVSAATQTGDIKFPTLKSQSGFKVGAGLVAVEREWILRGEYTWFRNTGNSTNTYDFSGFSAVFPLFVSDPINHGEVNWNSWFQRVDLDLAATLMPNYFFTLHPYLGLTGAWDDQDYYIFGVSSSAGEANHFTIDQKWYGVGPKVGLEGIFHLWQGCNAEIDLGCKGDIGQAWDLSNLHFVIKTNNTPRLVNMATRSKLNHVSPFFDVQLGFSGKYFPWPDKLIRAYLDLKWDMQVWLNHNRMKTPKWNVQNYGSYSMQGLTATFGMSF